MDPRRFCVPYQMFYVVLLGCALGYRRASDRPAVVLAVGFVLSVGLVQRCFVEGRHRWGVSQPLSCFCSGVARARDARRRITRRTSSTRSGGDFFRGASHSSVAEAGPIVERTALEEARSPCTPRSLAFPPVPDRRDRGWCRSACDAWPPGTPGCSGCTTASPSHIRRR